MLIENSWGQLCAPGALLGRFEWKHLQVSARRHAREDGHRYAVVGVKATPDGGWHYYITPVGSTFHAQHQLKQERQLLERLAEREKREVSERLQKHCPHPGTFRGEQCYACGAVA